MMPNVEGGVSQGWIPLAQLGPEALEAHRNLRAKKGLALPKPSRIQALIQEHGKFTVCVLKSGTKYATGAAARNPEDRPNSLKGRMFSLARALREMGDEATTNKGETK